MSEADISEAEFDFDNAYIPIPLKELEPGTPIKYNVQNKKGEMTVEPTEAVFLGTTHGAVRLKGNPPGLETDEIQEYQVGEMKIDIMERLEQDPWESDADE